MNEHEKTQSSLPQLIAGTLSPSEAARVRSHLAECGECARQEQVWRGLARAMKRIPETLPTSVRLARIAARAQARREEVLERRWNRLVLACLIAVGWLFGLGCILNGGLMAEIFLNGLGQNGLKVWSVVFVGYLVVSTVMTAAILPLLWTKRQSLHGKL